ncbi:MAG: LysM peptidoglycan-binding domain-containing protein [Bacteroidota bacterium]|nr:LysM peptidoglycan-binding domain-containing protein [Bacteroidota bacterium]
MIKRFLLFLFIFCVHFSYAQQNNLEIKGTGATLYLEHIIAPKENFYSIGRMYNVPPKDIAEYNNLQFENGLSIGQTIKIPLTENNFSQTESSEANVAMVPVYHSVEPKEGLYRISMTYNKVPLNSIKKWNHLQSDEVSAGAPLIVGYLKVDKEQSPLALKSIAPDMSAANVPKKADNVPPVEPDITPDKLPPVRNPDAEKEETKSATPAETTQQPKMTVKVNTKNNTNFSGGYFKKLYNVQVEKKSPVSEAGSAGVFKSTSGWQDGKYYCFNNDAAPGTIIKITENSSGKSVFAKVLDAIPDIKQNEGLAIIISNSASEELGTNENKFDCSLSYVK